MRAQAASERVRAAHLPRSVAQCASCITCRQCGVIDMVAARRLQYTDGIYILMISQTRHK